MIQRALYFKIMKINKVVFNFLFLFGDVLAIVTAFLSTYLLRQSLIVQEVLGFITEASNYLSFYDFNLFTIKSAGLFVVLMFLLGGYKFSLKDRFKVHLSYLLRAIVLWGSFAMLYFLLIRTFPFSRSVFLASIILAFVLIAVFRFFVLKLKIRL